MPKESRLLRRMVRPLDALADAWISRVRIPRRRAAIAAFLLVAMAALLWARHGTMRDRIVAAACILLPAVVAIVARQLEARVWKTPAEVIRRVAGSVDAESAGRALRALSLLPEDGREHDPGTSAELAELHVARAVAALPADRVASAADSLGQKLGLLALVLGVSAAGLLAGNPWRLFEGLDVLAASNGVAPVNVAWFEDLALTLRPPDYLHEEVRQARAYGAISAARGTLLTVSGVLAHAGRPVALSDGTSEVPFVDDGKGRVVARWPLGESVDLQVVVRFGEVLIREPEVTHVRSIADAPPTVVLEGAPRKVMLATAEGDGTIPIRYEAEDDHGLRDVHLVLRSGVREERRVLSRPDGETRFDRGGYVLREHDAFIKKSHAPIEVTVEAKDNDPITGPKWGSSAAIAIVPPDVGEPEATRLDALRRLRDAYVDVLAFRMSHDVPADATTRTAFLTEEVKRETDAAELLDTTLIGSYAGISVPRRLKAMLKGQASKVREAVNKEAAKPSTATHTALVGATERLVLVIDGVVRGLGQKDTRAASRDLADVADDLALGASQMQRPTDRPRGELRMDASTLVLNGGAKSLVRLGVLGRDIGEIVTNDLSRVGRAKSADDLVHAEIAAQDLAARLRQPDPAFGSGSRSTSRAGGESGGGRGTAGDASDGDDDGAKAFDEAASELEGIASDHATEISKVEQDLREGTDEVDLKEVAAEMKKHAEAVRDAVRELPKVSAGSDSWTSKGSAARENAEAMARALEQGNIADGVTSGHGSLDAMDEAKRTAERERYKGLFAPTDGDSDRTEASKELERAKKKLDPEVTWAEQRLASLRRKAAERKSGNFSEDADEEQKIAERAKDLSRKGRGDALPDDAVNALEEAHRMGKEAADALKHGDVDRGLERQREAQHQLEMAREALGGESDGQGDGNDTTTDNSDVVIPKADAAKGAEQFRRRVLKGLSQSAGSREREAVRRYAEGLLR